MIFNTFAYYSLFLVPAALLFRKASPAWQPWVVDGVTVGDCTVVGWVAETRGVAVALLAPGCAVLVAGGTGVLAPRCLGPGILSRSDLL